MDKAEVLRKIDEFNKKAEEQRSNQAQPPAIPQVPNTVNLTKEQEELLRQPVGSLGAQQRIERQAIQTSSDVIEAEKKREEDERRRQIAEGKAIDKLQQAGSNVSNAALDAVGPSVRWLEGVPTPLGLGAMIGIIVLLVLFLVPVDASGNTRAKLIFYTITGKTKLAQVSGSPNGNNPTSTTVPNNPTQTPLDINNMVIPDLTGINLAGL